jgi:TP901 family phage tail tape measure protein
VNDISALAQQAAMSGGVGQNATREVSVLLSANTGPYQQEMKQAASVTEQLADSMHKAEQAYKRMLKGLGAGMVGMGAAMQGIAAAGQYQAVQFEEMFARVAKTTGLTNTFAGQSGRTANFLAAFGVGDNKLQQFENDIRALSTQIPVAVQELSYLADVAGTLGVESDNLVLFSETAANLGAAINELGSDQAIAGLANLIGAFGDAEESVVNLGSSLADLSNHTRGRADEMLQFGDRVSGIAVQVGMASHEVLGLGAAISAIGVQPEAGASAILQVMTDLSRAIQLGGEEARKFAQAMGMSAEQLERMWNEDGSTAVLMKLIEALSLQGEQATLTLQQLGLNGIRVSQVLGGLAAQYGVLTDAMNQSREAYLKGEAVGELAEVRYDTMIKSLQRFRQATAEVFRSMGQAFLEPMKAATDRLTWLVNLFNELPQPIKTTIGAFLALGGAALTAAGVFTILFAKFHMLVILLHEMPKLFTKLGQVIGRLSGSTEGSARSIEALSRYFKQLGAILSDLPGALGAAGRMLVKFANDLGAKVQTALATAIVGARAAVEALKGALLMALPAAAGVASQALSALHNVASKFTKWLVYQFTLTHMGHALQYLGVAAKFATRSLLPLLGLLAKPLLILGGIAALAASVPLVTRAFRGWKESGEGVVGTMHQLAGAIDATIAKAQELASELDKPSTQMRLLTEGKEAIETLMALSDEDAQRFVNQYTLELLQGGMAPDEVRRQVEELAHLTRKPLVFEFEMSGNIDLDLRTKAGFEKALEIASESLTSALDSYQTKQDSWLRRAWHTGVKGEPTPMAQAEIDEAINRTAILANQSNNWAARAALQIEQQQTLAQGVRSGGIDRRAAQAIERQLMEADVVREGASTDNWYQRNVQPGLQWFNRGALKWLTPFDEKATWADPLTGGVGIDPREQLARMFEDTSFRPDELREMGKIVREITGETGSLANIIRGMDDTQLAQVTRRFKELGAELKGQEIERLVSGVDFDTQLGHRIGMAEMYAGQNPDDQARYIKNVFETFPQEVGFARALREAQTELDKLMEQGKGFTEEADRYREAIKGWAQEWNQIRIADLERELNALTAAEQVRFLNDELERLDMNAPQDVEIRVRIIEMRQQAYEREVGEFRQTMARYDQLINQREETIKGHNERMARMEEDNQRRTERMEEDHQRNLAKMGEQHAKQLSRMAEQREKAITRAREQHAKRMEQIDKQEKKALEDRVETMAGAFNIMQRIQATPTAEIGVLGHNMEAQNRAMREMTANLEQLRKMGLNEDVMKEMGLNDPRNFAQAERLLKTAMSNPQMIEEINKLWKDRLKLSEAFIEQMPTDEIKERFDEMRRDAEEALKEQIADIRKNHEESVAETQRNYRERVAEVRENYARSVADAEENYARSVEDANKAHAESLKRIGEELGKLGDRTFETIEELQQKALDSGLEKLADWANEITALQEEIASMNALLERRSGRFTPGSPADIDKQWGIRYDEMGKHGEETGKHWIRKVLDGYKAGTRGTWVPIAVSMLKESGSVSDLVDNRFGRAVTAWLKTLEGAKEQDQVWNPAESAAQRGARKIRTAVETELHNGISGIDREMGAWVNSIERHLNPVLEAVGEKPIQIKVEARRKGGSGAGGFMAAADGAILPNQAVIQRPGTLVQWAEPETGGEAFIPLHPSKRKRSTEIWKETGRRLGIDVSFARGGFLEFPDLSNYGSIGHATDEVLRYVGDRVGMAMEGFAPSVGADGKRTDRYGGVMPWVAWSGDVVSSRFGPFPGGIGGFSYRNIAGTNVLSDHALGLALDFMVGDSPRGHAQGDRVARFLLSNWTDHAMKYLIWKQRISYGGGWSSMASRGSRTADHWDHPHASYKNAPGPGFTRMAQGGILMDEIRKGVDAIPAWLSHGEYVVNEDATDHYGRDMLDAINAKRFARGGIVGHGWSSRGRESTSGGSQIDLVNALTRALENASFGSSETNHWDVKVEANDVKTMVAELDRRKRLSRLTQGGERIG